MRKTFTLFLALVVSLLTLQAGAAMHIVGDGPFGGWNPAGGVTMTGHADGTYTYTATVSGKVYFVFADGLSSSSDDWDTFNNNYRYGPTNGDRMISTDTWINTQRGSNGAYYFTGTGSTYVFKFDTINKRFRVEDESGTHVNPVTGKLYVLGEAEGNSWDPSVGVQMNTTDGNVFTALCCLNQPHFPCFPACPTSSVLLTD